MSEAEPIEETEAEGGRWPVERLKPLLEAMIFAVADPLTPRRVCDAIDGATTAEVKAAAAALQTEYAERGVRLVEVAGGWQFRTAAEHHAAVRQLFKDKPLRLTRAAIETVAIVAYKQPATRAEIESVRGVDSAAVLENLVEKKVLKIAGRRDVPGRPLVYTTTPFFLELFGLKDMKALPTLAELGDEIGNLASVAEFGKSEEAGAAILPLEDDEASIGAPESSEAFSEATDAEHGAEDGRPLGTAGEIPKVRFERSEEPAGDGATGEAPKTQSGGAVRTRATQGD
jgi:segregation and condensation protein B